MELAKYFKSIIDSDNTSVVICDTEHTIIYINQAAAKKYGKRGGYELVGSSLLDCHNEDSREKIIRVLEWFRKSPENNRVYTFHNEKENRDVYMIAVRNGEKLIGYYEKHEYRDRESMERYKLD